MNDEIARLTTQIDLLNKFISLLMEKNKQLENDIAYLMAEGRQKSASTAHTPTDNGMLEPSIAYTTTDNGQLDFSTTHTPVNNGQLEPSTAHTLTDNRQLGLSTAYTPAVNGMNQADTTLFAEKQYHDALFNVLWREMKPCKFVAISHASALLMHFYGQPVNSHKHLSGMLRLTESGISKQIAMLKKRQFVVRTAYQQYTLTPRALAILQEAARMVSGQNKTE